MKKRDWLLNMDKPNTRRDRTKQFKQAIVNHAAKEYAQNNIEQHRFDSMIASGVIVRRVIPMVKHVESENNE